MRRAFAARADALSFDNTFNRVQDRLKISELETRFATLWDAAGGPELQREYRFAPPRRWRADFAWPQARLLVEIEGGLWKRGRHLTPQGFAADAAPPLTTVRIDGTRIGRLAAEMVVARAESQPRTAAVVDIGFSIVERLSA